MMNDKIKKNYPLAELASYKIGGPAEYFVNAQTSTDVEEAFAWAKENNIAVTVLGGGSNILIADEGIKGLVIHLNNQKIEIDGEILQIGAGVEVKTVAELALEKTLSGIEWSIGIPGSMGGAIRGNAGAHGGAFDTVVENVTMFNSKTFSWSERPANECHFAYRHSIFKEEPQWIIWEITLKLGLGNKTIMTEEMEGYREYRRTSQPKEPSCGCIFKNLFAADVEKINPELYKRAAADGKIRGGKIGAGYLVQLLNLKEYQVGNAKISEKHANFIVNLGDAKADDVITIAEKVISDVRAEFGIELEEEVQRLGC